VAELKDLINGKATARSIEAVSGFFDLAMKKWGETEINKGIRSESELIELMRENMKKPFDYEKLIDAARKFD
jgi:hypothetical protein